MQRSPSHSAGALSLLVYCLCPNRLLRATFLEIMSNSAVVTNAALIAFTSSLCKNYTWTVRIWIFIGICVGVLRYADDHRVLSVDVSGECCQ